MVLFYISTVTYLLQKMLQRARLPAKSILTRIVHLENLPMQLKLLMALKVTCLHLGVNVHYLQTSNQKLSYMLTLVLFLEFITSRYFIEQATQNGVLQMDLSADSWDFLCSYQTQRTKQLECFVFGTHCTPFILSQL